MKKKVITPQIEWIQWILLTILFYLAFLPNVSLAETTTNTNTTTSPSVSYTDYFTLKINRPSNVNASVDYQTRDGSAKAGTDYIATSGTATIPAGQTSIDIGVDILTSSSNVNKNFSLVLKNPRGAAFPVGTTEIVVSHTIKEPLAAPKNFNASAGDGQVTLTWDNVNNADSYTVYQAQDAALTPDSYALYQGGIMLANQSSPLRLNGLNNGSRYYFIVTANQGSQESPASPTVPAQPQTTVVSTATGKLNDTGITRCANDSSNDLDCPVAGYPNQDAENGTNRMSFTKLDGGKCVKDNTTGLIWEVKQDKNDTHGDSLHDADDRYNWYNPDNTSNGGNAGGSSYYDSNICYGYQSGNNHCNTHAYIQRVNIQGWCGYSDWRLPSREELRSIVNYGNYRLAIDSDYFPNTHSSSLYWSSSSDAFRSHLAWLIDFSNGQNLWYRKSDSLYVRLVRSRQ